MKPTDPGEFIANLKAEQQNKVLQNKMKLEDASKTDELKSTQAELAAEQVRFGVRVRVSVRVGLGFG